MTRRRPLLGNLALAAATSAVGVLSLEVALRVFPLRDNLHATASLGIYAPDVELGWTLRPGVRREVVWLGRMVVIRTNAEGRRVPDREESVADGSLVFAGDSYTFGNEVDAEETFAFKTGAAVSAPVVNLGVGGYSLYQSCRSLERYLTDSKPTKHAFLVVFIGNDIEYGSSPERRSTGVSADGNLVQLGPGRALYDLMPRSRVAFLVFKAVDVAQVKWRNWRLGRTTSYRWIYDDDAWRQGSLESHTRSIRGVVAAARQAHAPLTVVLLPEREQVYGHLSDLPNRKTAAEIQELGISVLDLLPTLRERAQSDSALFNAGPTGHLSPSGHEAVVAALVEYLRSEDRTGVQNAGRGTQH